MGSLAGSGQAPGKRYLAPRPALMRSYPFLGMSVPSAVDRGGVRLPASVTR
jgi:hypothetical protein